jgi:hypothetical protein
MLLKRVTYLSKNKQNRDRKQNVGNINAAAIFLAKKGAKML